MCSQIGNAAWLMKVTDCMQPAEATKRYSRWGKNFIQPMHCQKGIQGHVCTREKIDLEGRMGLQPGSGGG